MSNKKSTSAKNLLSVIKNNMVTITNTELHYKCEDTVKPISTETIISDLEFYEESGIFADTIDFKYQKISNDIILVQAGNMSPYCECSIMISLKTNKDIPMEKIENMLTGTLLQKSA